MKPFCVLPFVQFSTTVSGDYQACCIAKQQQENIIDMTPLEFFNELEVKLWETELHLLQGKIKVVKNDKLFASSNISEK